LENRKKASTFAVAVEIFKTIIYMKRIAKVILILTCLAGASYFSFHANPKIGLPAGNMALENVDALADGEYNSVSFFCAGSGTIDCNGAKVAYKLIDYGIGL
jgi:hypothetical protein